MARDVSTIDEKTGVEKPLVRGTEAMGGIAIKLPSMFYSGIPDRLLLFPTGIAAFIETKRPKGGKYEPGQPKWLRRLSRLGFIVRTLYNVDEVRAFLEEVAALIHTRKNHGTQDLEVRGHRRPQRAGSTTRR